MRAPTDYYAVLGVEPGADDAAIKAAIRAIRSRHRRLAASPDRAQSRRADDMLALLALVERDLLDPARRAAYDAARASGPPERPGPPPNPAAAPNPAVAPNPAAQPGVSKPPSRDLAALDRHLTAARGYLNVGRVELAVDAATAATAADPSSPEAWSLLAHAHLTGGQLPDAVDAATRANALRPDDPDLVALLGEASTEAGQHEAAITCFRTASRLEPHSMTRRQRLVGALAWAGHREAAIDLGRELVAAHPRELGPRATLAEALLYDAETTLRGRPGTAPRCLTSPQEIAHYAKRLDEAAALGSLGTAIDAHVAEARRPLERARRMRWRPSPGAKAVIWTGSMVSALVLVQGVLHWLSGDAVPLTYWAAGTAVFAGATAPFAWHRQWKLDRKDLGPLADLPLDADPPRDPDPPREIERKRKRFR
ncbi:tetratricopeptide repeat protein [Micrococcales bacterium 31B]|nr:tetratricopeptide repeat protein [Micrococcales bacterium 31B]